MIDFKHMMMINQVPSWKALILISALSLVKMVTHLLVNNLLVTNQAHAARFAIPIQTLDADVYPQLDKDVPSLATSFLVLNQGHAVRFGIPLQPRDPTICLQVDKDGPSLVIVLMVSYHGHTFLFGTQL